MNTDISSSDNFLAWEKHDVNIDQSAFVVVLLSNTSCVAYERISLTSMLKQVHIDYYCLVKTPMKGGGSP